MTMMLICSQSGRPFFHISGKSLISPPSTATGEAHLGPTDCKSKNFPSRFSVGFDCGSTKSVVRTSVFSSHNSGDLRPEIDENPEGILSGEWPENFSLLSYDDLRVYLETQIAHDRVKPTGLLGNMMSTTIRTAGPDQMLEEIDHHFIDVSGLPVIDENLRCVGVISKKDKAKATQGLKSKVSEVMSSPAITLSPENTVLEAASLMLKEKIHRIPILNQKQQVVGMVTRRCLPGFGGCRLISFLFN
ncbi:hypothetical protein HPP92_002443 [Vanilla planifolia]|uniref:CBS domain-containing protein n=1 Tax=Vanilla planifolia TaxID=51239 RepID=A0A835VGA7_VANPL|nr:hypothetical protein HPP92_002443 [Vanilla planifolia]